MQPLRHHRLCDPRSVRQHKRDSKFPQPTFMILFHVRSPWAWRWFRVFKIDSSLCGYQRAQILGRSLTDTFAAWHKGLDKEL